MQKQQFLQFIELHQGWIKNLEEGACKIHQDVNQRYGTDLPYGFHLKLTASYVLKYGYRVAKTETDILVLFASAYLHDTIEDARMTYDDVALFLKSLNEKQELHGNVGCVVEHQVPEIVYALTNEKGRTRKERANANYYKRIRETPFAPFVKLCDRLANIHYTTLFVFTNQMLEIYRKEHPAFIDSIHKNADAPLPAEMLNEAMEMLEKKVFVVSE